jgi:hypothetical protein
VYAVAGRNISVRLVYPTGSHALVLIPKITSSEVSASSSVCSLIMWEIVSQNEKVRALIIINQELKWKLFNFLKRFLKRKDRSTIVRYVYVCNALLLRWV